MSFTLQRRLVVERSIVRAALKEAVKQGWKLESVYNGSDDFPIMVKDVQSALMEAFVADTAQVRFNRPKADNTQPETAWFFFVYGNSGWDVLSDYTVNLEAVVNAIEPLVARYEAEDA